MPKLKTLLLHPDPEVRADLRRRLRDASDIQVLGEAVSAFEAMELLEAIPYSVFFLAVDLPDGVSGVELAQMLLGRKRRPALVFIAASEAAAFQAIELGAADYLLWPFSAERLDRTIERLRQFRLSARDTGRDMGREPSREQAFRNAAMARDGGQGGQGGSAPPPMATGMLAEDDESTVSLPLEEDEEDRFIDALKNAWDRSYRESGREPGRGPGREDEAERSGGHGRHLSAGGADERTGGPARTEIGKLPISLDGRMMLIPYAQIIFVEAYEDYSYVHTATQKFLTSYRLKNLEDRLKPHRFFRVHRKYLVNLDMVTEIASLPGSNFMLRTAGRTRIELPISRRRIADLKQILGL